MVAEINVSKVAVYHHLKAAALSLINERTFYELELTVSCLIQSDCFSNTRLQCYYLGTYRNWRWWYRNWRRLRIRTLLVLHRLPASHKNG